VSKIPPLLVHDIERVSGEVDCHAFVLLTARGRARGSCEVLLARQTAGLRRLWVDPKTRRRGLGRELFTAAVEEARRAGKWALTWQVKDDNSAAILFYLKCGAAIVHDDGDGYYWMSVPISTPEVAS